MGDDEDAAALADELAGELEQGESALATLKTRSDDADPLVRYWAVLGLMAITQIRRRSGRRNSTEPD